MSIQTADYMYINGKEYELVDVEIDKQMITCVEFDMPESNSRFAASTACWRGYAAKYHIEDDLLYAVKQEDDDSRNPVKSPKTFLPYTGSCIIARSDGEQYTTSDVLNCYIYFDEAYELYFANGRLKEQISLASAIEKAMFLRNPKTRLTSEQINMRNKIAREPLKYKYDRRTYRWRHYEWFKEVQNQASKPLKQWRDELLELGGDYMLFTWDSEAKAADKYFGTYPLYDTTDPSLLVTARYYGTYFARLYDICKELYAESEAVVFSNRYSIEDDTMEANRIFGYRPMIATFDTANYADVLSDERVAYIAAALSEKYPELFKWRYAESIAEDAKTKDKVQLTYRGKQDGGLMLLFALDANRQGVVLKLYSYEGLRSQGEEREYRNEWHLKNNNVEAAAIEILNKVGTFINNGFDVLYMDKAHK